MVCLLSACLACPRGVSRLGLPAQASRPCSSDAPRMGPCSSWRPRSKPPVVYKDIKSPTSTFPRPTAPAEPPPTQHGSSPGRQTSRGWRDPPPRTPRAGVQSWFPWPGHIHLPTQEMLAPNGRHSPWGDSRPRSCPARCANASCVSFCCHVTSLIKTLLEARIKLPLPISSCSWALFTEAENSSGSGGLASPRRQRCSSQSDHPQPTDRHLADL